jgi:hypothetical protein
MNQNRGHCRTDSTGAFIRTGETVEQNPRRAGIRTGYTVEHNQEEHASEHGILYCRTDPQQKKRGGDTVEQIQL